MKRLGIYHSKDMDGYVSGAVLKHKFPDIELLGWDYADELISLSKLIKYEHVVMIDVTFPIDYMVEVAEHVEFYKCLRVRLETLFWRRSSKMYRVSRSI